MDDGIERRVTKESRDERVNKRERIEDRRSYLGDDSLLVFLSHKTFYAMTKLFYLLRTIVAWT